MSSTNLLSQGNRLQRAYYRWAQPRYARIALKDPGLALEMEEVDQFLYSRRGLLAWFGWLLGLVGLTVGVRMTGAGWVEAAQFSVLLWVALSLALMSSWFSPHSAGSSTIVKGFVMSLLLGLAGGAIGLFAVKWIFQDEVNWAALQEAANRVTWPILLLVLGIVLFSTFLSWAGRKARQQRLQRLQLLAERDAARAAAAETELRLLQAQIHPHFVFNTLATLQHWVDKADPRAGPLLRELTGFLRGSTEMLGRSRVPLGDEVRAAAHYLAIMQARMGERLRFEIDVDPPCAAQPVPPGLLLTLVENAIEHGLEPKIEGGTLRLSSGCSDRDGRGQGGWWLRVEDDGLGLSPQARDQVGLSNLRQRLQQHYGSRARFTLQALATGGTRAELHFEEAACPAS
jgi:signal transduction histidine kinase